MACKTFNCSQRDKMATRSFFFILSDLRLTSPDNLGHFRIISSQELQTRVAFFCRVFQSRYPKIISHSSVGNCGPNISSLATLNLEDFDFFTTSSIFSRFLFFLSSIFQFKLPAPDFIPFISWLDKKIRRLLSGRIEKYTAQPFSKAAALRNVFNYSKASTDYHDITMPF